MKSIMRQAFENAKVTIGSVPPVAKQVIRVINRADTVKAYARKRKPRK